MLSSPENRSKFLYAIQTKADSVDIQEEIPTDLLAIPTEIFSQQIIPYLENVDHFSLTCKSFHWMVKNYNHKKIQQIVQSAHEIEKCIQSESIGSLFGTNEYLNEPSKTYIPFKFDINKWTRVTETPTKIIAWNECELDLVEALAEYKTYKTKHLTFILYLLTELEGSPSLSQDICIKALLTTVGRIKGISSIAPYLNPETVCTSVILQVKGEPLAFAPWIQVKFWNCEHPNWTLKGEKGYRKVKHLNSYIRADHLINFRTGDRWVLSSDNLNNTALPVILRCSGKIHHFQKTIKRIICDHIWNIRIHGDRYGYASRSETTGRGENDYGEKLEVAQKLLKISNQIQEESR